MKFETKNDIIRFVQLDDEFNSLTEEFEEVNLIKLLGIKRKYQFLKDMTEGGIFIDNSIVATQLYVASWYMEILKFGGYADFQSDRHIQSILVDFRELVIDVSDSFTLFRDLSAENFINGVNAVQAIQNGNLNKASILDDLRKTQVSLYFSANDEMNGSLSDLEILINF